METPRYNKSVLVRQDAIGLKIYLHTWLTDDNTPYAKIVLNLGSMAQFDIKFDPSELFKIATVLAELFNAKNSRDR